MPVASSIRESNTLELCRANVDLGQMWTRFQPSTVPQPAEAKTKLMAVVRCKADPYSSYVNFPCSLSFRGNTREKPLF